MKYRPTLAQRLRRIVCRVIGHQLPLDARMRPQRLAACVRCGAMTPVKR